MTQTEPPGGDRAAADSDEDSAADSLTPKHPRVPMVLARWILPRTGGAVGFGFDSIDTLELACIPWGFDIIDILDEADEVPTHCHGCGHWLYADHREGESIGLCWQCRAKLYDEG